MSSGMPELHITMPDGSVWSVNADIIARDRATYYSEQEDDPSQRTVVWNEEYNITMTDDYSLTDWASNNMNWSDVSQFARQISPARDVDFQEGWMNGERKVVR